MAYSCGLTISKGIKAKLFEDPAMQDAQHLKSMSLKIRSYAIQRKDNCKLTEILQQTKSQTAAASKGRQVFKQQQIIWNLNLSIAQNLDLAIYKKNGLSEKRRMKITSPIKILAQATKEMPTGRNVRQLNQVWELEHSSLVSSAWLEAGS